VNDKPDKSTTGLQATTVPLAERLAAVATDIRTRLVDYTTAMDNLVARLVQSGAGTTAPAVGDVFPDFILPDGNNNLWQLSVALKDGPVVLAFHRGYWCDFCTINMRALAEISPRITGIGSRIVAISPEHGGQSSQLAKAADADFPVLCDIGLGLSTLLGLTFVVDDALRHELERLGVDITVGNGMAGWILPIPATFVLDAAGRVVARHVDPDPRIRMDPDAILQAATACQSAARS
jgi:peroxiredoxin